MSNPEIPDGQAENPSLAASNKEAQDIVEQLRDFIEIDDTSKQYAVPKEISFFCPRCMASMPIAKA